MPADTAADRADLLALQQGDTGALERIVARWEAPLCSFAWRYLRNATDARELALETFVRLHERRDRLRADTNLSAWLFTTLTNFCHNRYRWWRRHPAVSLDDANENPATTALAEEGTPQQSAEHGEALLALDHAIAALPHDQRTALLLHHFEHLSYREIATVVGCSERGVETRLYRARQTLRDALLTAGVANSAV